MHLHIMRRWSFCSKRRWSVCSKQRWSILMLIYVSYPHFGPKNTRSNFFLFLVISNSLCLFYNSYCATNAHFTVIITDLLAFKTVQSVFALQVFKKGFLKPLHFLVFYSNFCIKSYKRVFWSFPAMEPIFEPLHFSLSLFNSSVRIICQFCLRIISALRLSHFGPQGRFGLFTLFDFWAERYFKIPHFGNLFVLVRLVIFSCFALRFFQITFFTNFTFFLQMSPNFIFNCKYVQFLISEQSNSFFFKAVQILLFCRLVL